MDSIVTRVVLPGVGPVCAECLSRGHLPAQGLPVGSRRMAFPERLLNEGEEVLIDRTDKRKIIVSADALGLAVTAAVPLTVVLGVFSLPLLYVPYQFGGSEGIRNTRGLASVSPDCCTKVLPRSRSRSSSVGLGAVA